MYARPLSIFCSRERDQAQRFFQEIKALFEWVQQNVRYTKVWAGLGL
jgi:hypothetical protein